MNRHKAVIYTRTGDEGTTGLFGGSRVAKDCERVEVYGTLDELWAAIAVVKTTDPDECVSTVLSRLQGYGHDINAEIASDQAGREKLEHHAGPEDITWIEGIIDTFDADLPKLDHFIVPDSSAASAFLNVARTVCRRAERRLWTLSRTEEVNPHILKFINRLSDLLFTLMRYENRRRT